MSGGTAGLPSSVVVVGWVVLSAESADHVAQRVAPTLVRNRRCQRVDEFGQVSVCAAQEVFHPVS